VESERQSHAAAAACLRRKNDQPVSARAAGVFRQFRPKSDHRAGEFARSSQLIFARPGLVVLLRLAVAGSHRDVCSAKAPRGLPVVYLQHPGPCHCAGEPDGGPGARRILSPSVTIFGVCCSLSGPVLLAVSALAART
jgi:hypothetical protein